LHDGVASSQPFSFFKDPGNCALKSTSNGYEDAMVRLCDTSRFLNVGATGTTVTGFTTTDALGEIQSRVAKLPPNFKNTP
jgi:hypothetical protein